MRKTLITVVLVISIALVFAGCGSVEKTEVESTPETTPVQSVEGTEVSGRIIETVDGDYTIIRNEEDTSIYYEIDLSSGVITDNGVSDNLEPNNVISAVVEVLDEDDIPIQTKLIKITVNNMPDYQVIDAEQAKALIDGGDVIILDVRTRTEYESGYIPNAFNLPLGEIEAGIQNITSYKDSVLLVYCRSGNRSKVAARELTELGYTNVYDFGGIVNWPYEIIEN